MTRPAAAVCLFALFPAAAIAEPCQDLHGLVEQLRAETPDIPPPEAFSDAERCALSRDDRGVRTYLCHWTFPYRARHATEAFEDLNRDIGQCFATAMPLPDDTAVNHPDSYDLRQYRIENMAIAVSLKDKAALDQTLVFLRLNAE